MAQKIIKLGDIVRIRYNNSAHGFPINTLGVVKECRPKRSDNPNLFKVAIKNDWWWVDIDDLTLFSRVKEEDDF